jgi:hypothetical protein
MRAIVASFPDMIDRVDATDSRAAPRRVKETAALSAARPWIDSPRRVLPALRRPGE